MKVTEIPFEFATRPQTRSKGLHLSTIIRAIEKDIYGAEKRPDMTPDQERRLQAKFEMGLIWEEAIQLAFAKSQTRDREGLVLQQELCEDGITMTPDCYDSKNRVVEEYKYTKVSTTSIDREGFEKRWPGYLMQMKSYCRARRTSKAKLVALFVNGDYKWGTPGADEVVRQWLFEFTRQELEENWLLVLRKRDELQKGAKDVQRAAGAVRRPLVLGRNRGDRVPDLGRARGGEAGKGDGGAGGGGRGGEVEPLPWLNFRLTDDTD